MNIEQNIADNTDFDNIAKYPSSPFQCIEREDGRDKNGPSIKVLYIAVLYLNLVDKSAIFMTLF